MIVRPPEYLDDVRERELEMQAAEARLHQLGYLLCPHCDHEVEQRLPALPELPAQAQGPVHELRQAAGAGVDDLPVLRDRGRRGDVRRPAGAVVRTRNRTSRPRSSPASSRPLQPRRRITVDRTLILVKPDAFARGLTGEIIARFERKGLRIVALKHMQVTEELAKQHYAEHAERAVLRRARRVHHLGPARRDGPRGPRRHHGRPPGHRRDQPAGGRHRLDPRRLRHRGRPEHGPRLRLGRVRRSARPALFFPEL